LGPAHHWLLGARAFGYMLAVGGVHFVGLPWLLLTLGEGNSFRPLELRSGLAVLSGALCVLLGVGLALLSAVHLVLHGHGTPFPLDPTRVLVRCGPYRYVRNPQAVAATVIVLGECLLLESLLIWLLLPATLLYLEMLAAPVENWQLRRQFGGEYLAYRQQVPRWFPRRRANLGASRVDSAR
jgi:protein-S-isoprenylcysteine O-methyltransferase Ste14